VNDDAHSLFMALRLGYCYVKGVEKTPECFFRLHEASDEWGTFVQPRSISCCFHG